MKKNNRKVRSEGGIFLCSNPIQIIVISLITGEYLSIEPEAMVNQMEVGQMKELLFFKFQYQSALFPHSSVFAFFLFSRLSSCIDNA